MGAEIYNEVGGLSVGSQPGLCNGFKAGVTPNRDLRHADLFIAAHSLVKLGVFLLALLELTYTAPFHWRRSVGCTQLGP